MAVLLDGKRLSAEIRTRLTTLIRERADQGGLRPPGLGVVLVGSDPASQSYVASKERQARQCGLHTVQVTLPEAATQAEVAERLLALNNNPHIDGILLQLPLPRHLDAAPLLALIDPMKDADGLHTVNQGLLLKGQATALGAPLPCTPAGCMKLIDVAYREQGLEHGAHQGVAPEVSLAGSHAVVVGRSILVGKPLALLLLERHATVTIVHSKTRNPESICASADILCAASGVPHLIKKHWVKEGAVVIDVGINRLRDGSLVGDVAFDEVKDKVRAITPVPGGVGPMTVAMLLWNTYLLSQTRTGSR